jgi:CRP/FNR family cyclic AMP-dependent transcriptional regulator
LDLLETFKGSNDLVDFTAGTEIFHEDSEGGHMYVVISGEVLVTLKGKELAVAIAGEIVGEMALISADIRSATVTAISDCTLAVIDQSSFEALIRHVPEFSMHVMNVLVERIHKAYEKI